MKRNPLKWTCAILVMLGLLLPSIGFMAGSGSAAPVIPGTIDPTTIPKYVNQLTGSPPVYTYTTDAGGVRQYTVYMDSFSQQILPAVTNPATGTVFPMTKVWGYGGMTNAGLIYNSPGPSFEQTRGIAANVTYVNNIGDGVDISGNPSAEASMFPVDPTLHWANPNNIPMDQVMMNAMNGVYPLFPPGYNGDNTVPGNPSGWDAQSPVPLVPHLHGGEVQSTSDGGPEAWWTYDGVRGANYSSEGTPGLNEAIYHYPNSQQATTLWYHDHALGMTRLNVMSGLAGFYFLRDSADAVASLIPSGAFEVPLAIQDRTFNANGSFWFPSVGINPTIHPYWQPEFFGNTIMVNGLVWPNMNVDQGWYRLRLLDGSNARFYTLSFSNKMTFYQIGTDGGYLTAPAPMTQLTMAPGERADILVDFSNVPAGTKLILTNTAKAPFPKGAAADPQTVGQIMQFTVSAAPGFMKGVPLAQLGLPLLMNPTLSGTFPNLPTATAQRILVLVEVMGPAGPQMVLLDGQKWSAPVSEKPVVGTTEDWIIVDATADAHPIHLHLTQFQLVSRQAFQATKYLNAWLTLNGGMAPFAGPTQTLALAGYLQGKPVGAKANEMGWKDTIQVFPGEVTTIRVRFAAQDGSAYPFDASSGPGYVWHCHIIDHEDNEMMRPLIVMPAGP